MKIKLVLHERKCDTESDLFRDEVKTHTSDLTRYGFEIASWKFTAATNSRIVNSSVQCHRDVGDVASAIQSTAVLTRCFNDVLSSLVVFVCEFVGFVPGRIASGRRPHAGFESRIST